MQHNMILSHSQQHQHILLFSLTCLLFHILPALVVIRKHVRLSLKLRNQYNDVVSLGFVVCMYVEIGHHYDILYEQKAAFVSKEHGCSFRSVYQHITSVSRYSIIVGSFCSDCFYHSSRTLLSCRAHSVDETSIINSVISKTEKIEFYDLRFTTYFMPSHKKLLEDSAKNNFTAIYQLSLCNASR